MRTRKKFTTHVEALDSCQDDEGFIEGDISGGKTIATFNFGMTNSVESNNKSKDLLTIINKPAAALIPSVQTFKSLQRGSTPAVDGELYTIKRCYQFRSSTIRKLNELKANHADINVYLNTIIDEAISHYYDFIFKSGGNSIDSNC